MDDADYGSENEQHNRDVALAKIRHQNQPLKITGFCLNCGEPLPDRRFCDTWCAADFELVCKLKTIKGFR